MNLEKFLKFLNFKLFFFLAISLSVIGFMLIFANLLFVQGFPLEFFGIEIEFLEELPTSYFFIPLLYWNIPLLIVLVARLLYRKLY